jgi:hypothetical protein
MEMLPSDEEESIDSSYIDETIDEMTKLLQ